MLFFAITDKGRVRRSNQDYVFASDTDTGALANLFIVADGMGGHLAGEFASEQAVKTVLDEVRKKEKKEPGNEVLEETEEIIQSQIIIPDTFAGKIEDEYGVPKEVMKLITDYMDVYYRALFTLEDPDFSSFFDDERMEAICDRSVCMMLNLRRNYDFDFTMSKAHYDLKVCDYEKDGSDYKVFITEDDYMSFVFLPGIESQCFDIENYFVISSDDGVYKIHDLEKIQGYYMTFYDSYVAVYVTNIVKIF